MTEQKTTAAVLDDGVKQRRCALLKASGAHLTSWSVAKIANRFTHGRDWRGSTKQRVYAELAERASVDRIAFILRTHKAPSGRFGVTRDDVPEIRAELRARRASIRDDERRATEFRRENGRTNFAIENPLTWKRSELHRFEEALAAAEDVIVPELLSEILEVAQTLVDHGRPNDVDPVAKRLRELLVEARSTAKPADVIASPRR